MPFNRLSAKPVRSKAPVVYLYICLASFLMIQIITMHALNVLNRPKDYLVITGVGLILFSGLGAVSFGFLALGVEGDFSFVFIEEVGKALIIMRFFRDGLSKWCIFSFAAWELLLGKAVMMYLMGQSAGIELIDKNLEFFTLLSLSPVFMHLATERFYFLSKAYFLVFLLNIGFHYEFNSVADWFSVSKSRSLFAALSFLAASAAVYGAAYGAVLVFKKHTDAR